MNIIDIAIAKGYTEESLMGAGAIKGEKAIPVTPAKTVLLVNPHTKLRLSMVLRVLKKNGWRV